MSALDPKAMAASRLVALEYDPENEFNAMLEAAITAYLSAASPKGQVEAVADDGRTLAHNLADIARSLLSRPPELRGPFRSDEEALRRVAALPPRTSRSALSPAPAGVYEPTIIHNEEAGISELVLRDCPTYVAEELTVRAVRDMSDRSLIGFQWPAPSGGWAEAEDDFRGDNALLVRSINALLDLDAKGALSPHGVGGFARKLLAAAANRLPAAPSQVEG